MRLAVVASHPIQYQAPLFRELARRLDLCVLYAHRANAEDQAEAGFGVGFDWDVDLFDGYEHAFLRNVSRRPGLDSFGGCDTPEVGQALKARKADAVLTLGWRLKSDLQAAVSAQRLRLPLLTRGDSQLLGKRPLSIRAAKALAYPILLRAFDAALYVGQHSRAYWRRYGYPDERLFFSPHAVDAAWFAERATLAARTALRARLGVEPDRALILFAGKLQSIKRPLDVIAAADRLARDGRKVAVLVVGAGPLEKEMREAGSLAEAPCHDLGFLNQSAMPQAYAAADILVLPSESETWGLVANEALACGRPVVVSDAVGSAPDLAADGMAGRVFPTGDIDALAAALSGLLDRPPSRDAIASKSSTYSLAAAADGVEAALAYVRLRRYGED